MSKGEITREGIVREAALLFNTQGYGGGSMSQLMARTGLKKGGIYNHFASKEELTLEAFDYAVGILNHALAEVIRPGETAGEKLAALFRFYHEFPVAPLIEGGCPMLNAAVEADDANPVLKTRVSSVFREWQAGLTRIIAKGIARGEFRADVDAEGVATFIIAAVEGGIALSRGMEAPEAMAAVAAHLEIFVTRMLKP
jgi:AcrR family transcriptional regulator